MAERRADPSKLHKNAIPALGLFYVLACATPVIASQNLPSDCAELDDPGLQVPAIQLAAATIGENPVTEADSETLVAGTIKTATSAPLLDAPTESTSTQGLYGSRTPLVEAASGDDDTESTVPHDREPADRLPDMQTRFPGVSSVELKRFKRQMYRRDI